MAGERILLLEDDDLVGPLIEHVLLSNGYHVHLVSRVAEAQDLLRSRSYDLVIADALVPDGSGITVADEARTLGIKTLVISGNATGLPQNQLQGHEYALKPIRPTELLRLVQLAIDGKREAP